MDKNFLLGQLFSKIREQQHEDLEDIRTFLDRSDYDLNHQIPCDSFVAKRKPYYLGYTALHFSIEHKRLKLSELLLSYGADFTRKAGNGYTALRLAVKSYENLERTTLSTRINKAPELDLLLSAHLKTNNATNPSCNDGISHFHIACLTDNVGVVRFFLQAGVLVNQSIKKTSNFFPGWSPLHFAVRYGSEELVKLLLIHGADANQAESNGLTPLGLLVERSVEINDCIFLGHRNYNNTEIERELRQNDALIDIFIKKDKYENAVDDTGLSFFHVSCAKRDTSLAERFLELGADVNSKVKVNSQVWPLYSPLHFAARCNTQIFKLLLKKGADMTAKDAKGVTPFDLFIQRYEPAQVYSVLKVHPTMKHIRFEDGFKLVDAVRSIGHLKDLAHFECDIDGDNRLPENSCVWPGYTLTHVAIALSRVTYQFRHYYFVKKNHFIDINKKDNNVSFLKDCFCIDASLATQDANGMTPLHLAFYSQKINNFQLILRDVYNCEVEDRIDREGLSHLQIACIVDDVPLVNMYMRYGSSPDLPTQSDLTWLRNSSSSKTIYRTGSTLYHIAAANDSEAMIDEISAFGAKMDLLDADGLTAVHVGFLNNCSLNTLEVLLWYSDTQKTNYTAMSAGRLSHLHVACYARDIKSVEKLSAIAIDIEAPIDCRETTNSAYAEKLAPYDGWTPLHFAVRMCYSGELIDLLISKGADIRTRNAAGLNSLHLALMQRKDEDAEEVIKHLYCILKSKGEWRDDFGLTKLHVACILKDEDEIERLIKAGEDVNRQISVNSPIRPGDTALHILMGMPRLFGFLENIELLMRYGADLTLKNADDRTPLHVIWENEGRYSLEDNPQYIADRILEAGSRFYEVNPCNKDGLSHFHICCMIGDVNVVKNFIDSINYVPSIHINESTCPFANYFFQEPKGSTALHLAIRHYSQSVTQLLLSHGANLKLEDSEGITPIQAALIKSTMFSTISSHAQIDLQVEKNVFGETTLGLLLRKSYRSDANFKDLLGRGICIKFVDPPAKKTDIAGIAWKLDNDVFQAFVERATDVTNTDANGKNVIHSFGSLKVKHSDGIVDRAVRCASNVKIWLDKGCHINLRDHLGRTPLHDAAVTGGAAVNVLLLLGSDVNIRDNHGHTAFSYVNDKNTRDLFLNHMLMISCSGLDLDDSLDETVRNEFTAKSRSRKSCNRYLARMVNIRVAEDLTVRDLLRETVVRNFPRFHVLKRNVILEFLKLERMLTDYTDWKSWNNLFQLQYRKILRRTELMEPAKISFHDRIYQLDLPCIELILQNLCNNDLENLIRV